MTWSELERRSRGMVDQLRQELHGIEVVTLTEPEAAEMASQLLDGLALRELRRDDPAFVRTVVREDGLERVAEEHGDAAFDEALRASVVARMCGVMSRHLRTRRRGSHAGPASGAQRNAPAP